MARYNHSQKTISVDGKGHPIVHNTSQPAPDASYRLTNHCCTVCMGRLLIRRLPGRIARFEVVCAECGCAHIINDESEMPCWCNKHISSFGRDVDGKIFQCELNDNPRPELPNIVLVAERPYASNPQKEHINRSVFSEHTDYL